MAQFDVSRLGEDLLVVDLQTDLLGLDATRIVAPLRQSGSYTALPGLTPEVEIDGTLWIVRVQELAAVSASALRQPPTSLAHAQDALKRVIDVLISGF